MFTKLDEQQRRRNKGEQGRPIVGDRDLQQQQKKVIKGYNVPGIVKRVYM